MSLEDLLADILIKSLQTTYSTAAAAAVVLCGCISLMVQVRRVGRGVGALGVWGAKKWLPLL